jgi:type IV secretory pathway VirB9-like protein
MKRLLLLASLLSSPAYALDYCQVSAEDTQTRLCAYNPMQRYVVRSRVGFPVNLTFGDGERLKRYEFAYTGIVPTADGKSSRSASTWVGPERGQPDKKMDKDLYLTNMPIWPSQEGHSALIVVTQTEDGRERTYQFDLTGIPANQPDVNATTALRFTYKTEEDAAAAKAAKAKKEEAVAAWRAAQAKKSETAAIDRLRTEVFYGQRNWAYSAQADTKYAYLAPDEVSDNGWLTAFRWPGNVQPPTISIIDPATGEERTVVPSQQGDLFIVPTTAKQFRLRLGHEGAVMELTNWGWSSTRPDPHTGTTSPDVIRTVQYAK